jgi:integrase
LAFDLLRALAADPEPRGDYVFPRTADHERNIVQPWHAIRRTTGLEDLRLRDLRHVYATAAFGAGPAARGDCALLGHKSSIMTRTYAH